jgi:hypothetical protein
MYPIFSLPLCPAAPADVGSEPDCVDPFEPEELHAVAIIAKTTAMAQITYSLIALNLRRMDERESVI